VGYHSEQSQDCGQKQGIHCFCWVKLVEPLASCDTWVMWFCLTPNYTLFTAHRCCCNTTGTSFTRTLPTHSSVSLHIHAAIHAEVKTKNAFRCKHSIPCVPGTGKTLIVAKAPCASHAIQTSTQVDDSVQVKCQLLLEDCCKGNSYCRHYHCTIARSLSKSCTAIDTWFSLVLDHDVYTMEMTKPYQKACVYFINSHSSCVLHDCNGMRCLTGFY
jgi:hypothetical protein